jgi:fructose/tagatose bisphosphate aldolase
VPLVDARELLAAALRGRYAVGYFESWCLASLQGVVEAAESARAPVILGFNGDFLSNPARTAPGRRAEERLEWYGALGRAAAESAAVPCALIFNECPRDEWTERATRCGFNLVMPADPAAPPDRLLARVAALTATAHARGVAVEAEVGELPHGTPDGPGGALTEPAAAARAVAATGVDVLAVSVGNVHIRLHGEGGLDLRRLAALRAQVPVPLALHGGTGIAEEALRDAVRLGVAKVNFGTYLKQRALAAMRAALACPEPNPHHLLGMGGEEDVLVAVRHAVREAVRERLPWLECAGRA